ncbi:MAG: hypothetical protein WDZ68_00440, partial [Candidatus Paceibacterota bacterium]
MTFFAPQNNKTGAEESDEVDTDVNIDDSTLDEIAEPATTDDTAETEGFGHIDETEDTTKAKEEKDEEDVESLEDDAEDVDFDTFDDVDEL